MINWKSQLDKLTAEIQINFGSLTENELNWKPDAKSWSIAQNIDHLIVINTSYFPILEKLNSGTYNPPFLAKISFIVSFFGKFLLKSVQPDRQKKIKTFPIWEPSSSQIPGDILTKFSLHQDKLKKAINDARPFLDKGAVISSPANKHIVYKLDAAFDIIVTHERRHLEQAKEVLEQLKTSSPNKTALS